MSSVFLYIVEQYCIQLVDEFLVSKYLVKVFKLQQIFLKPRVCLHSSNFYFTTDKLRTVYI